MSDKHRHHSEGVDLDSRGVVNVGNFVEKHARLKGGSGVSSAPTFWPHAHHHLARTRELLRSLHFGHIVP